MDLYSSIQDTLNKKGINVVTGNMYDLMAICKEWYRGSVNDFHYYKVKLADGSTKPCERLTMNMPKKICEDFAKLLWTEKTRIELSSKKSTERLWNILDSKENSFTVNFPIFIEKVFALGTGAIVEYKNNGKTVIDYIEGDVIMPYKYTNSYINGLVTISTYTKGEECYTHITYHEYDGINYTRYNELYVSKDSNELGQEIDFSKEYPQVINPYVVRTESPYFQIFKTNIANNFDTSSPMGLSIIANSFDRFKAIDTKYDSFTREFDLGKKRILVESSALKTQVTTDTTGKVQYVKYFDSNDQAYVAIPGMEGQPVKEIDFTLRVQEHIDGINAELNWLSSNVGLGQNFYKFDGQAVKTATEVISENSDTFRSKEHHQIIELDGVYDMVKAICELEGISTKSINIMPDDSIIEDKNAIKKDDRQEVTMGLRSKKSYLTKNYGISDEEAEKQLAEIQEEQKQIAKATSMFSDEE